MLILASSSPRRHELLLAAGIEHIVRPISVEETRLPGEPARDFVMRLAREKGATVTAKEGDVILAADTVVLVDGKIFGKPVDREDAIRMLRALSGRDHLVYTGINLRRGNLEITEIAETRVWFIELTELEIEEYTRSGEYSDKAGAYAIQGLASKFVSEIKGCYHNVVGLPVSLVYQCLKLL
jgi:septum formation protein